MGLYILNTSMEILNPIDDYITLSWVERHNESGEFELELPRYWNENSNLLIDNYIVLTGSPTTMLIRSLQPTGDTLMVKGESSESLLKRRWTTQKIDVSGSIENIIYELVWDFLVDPIDTNRKMNNLDDAAYGSPIYPSDTYQNQFDISSIYDIVTTICKATGFGFKFVRTASKLDFQVYKGADLSSDVIFSEAFGNVITGSYYQSDINSVNIVNVITDDTVYPNVEVWLAGQSEPSDINRRETTIETTIDRDLDPEVSLTDPEVLAIINARGRNVIYENMTKGMFEGEFDIYAEFKLGEDFQLGDVVQAIIDGRESKARITEILTSHSPEEIISHVTLDFIDA